MFKKIAKKSISLLSQDDTEEQIEIKPLLQKKKVGKWLDIPTKSQQITSEQLSNILNASDPDSPITPQQVEEDANLYTIDKTPSFNEVFDSLAENLKNHSRLDSDENLSNSSEELQNEEVSVSSDVDDIKFISHTHQGSKLKLSDLSEFLKNKAKLIEETKNRYLSRLTEIRQKKSDFNEELAYLVLENHK